MSRGGLVLDMVYPLLLASFVCLKKERKWEADDFPTNTLQAMLATKIETPNLGCYGSKTALFQVGFDDRDKMLQMFQSQDLLIIC
ncbi:hypothetical protein SUGI_0464920 [Cryptomeria japonica]|nr:hypothetical protein SUGI_0464920 [Cryptomeria japonica]